MDMQAFRADTMLLIFVLLLLEIVGMDGALSIVSNPVTLNEPMTVTCSTAAVGGIKALGPKVTDKFGFGQIYMSKMVDGSEKHLVTFHVGAGIKTIANFTSITQDMLTVNGESFVLKSFLKLEKKAESSDLVKWKCVFTLIDPSFQFSNKTFEQIATTDTAGRIELSWVAAAVSLITVITCWL